MTIPDPLASALRDRYRIEHELGQGGMATVYLAEDLKHGRHVALKVLRAELQAALGPERFNREIRLAARLQHPHILTVLDSGEAAGMLWFTMPYVEGESLRARLGRERQLSLKDALRIAREAAQALQYAHEHGVVHRDIKPDNILLTKDGSTLVADFGIARALDAGQDGALTSTGMSLGTPAYMSPEQASGDREVDARTDIYALGAVLYELLAGEAPFTGPTVQAVIAKRFSQAAPSVRATRPNVPENVDRAIQRALAMVPGDRFPSTAAFAEALETAPVEPTIALPAAPAQPVAVQRRFAVSSALALGLILGAGVLFAWRRSAAPAQPAAGAPAVEAVTRLAVLPFENLGDTSDAYFADGVTDAVRGKLTSLAALQVIARGSSLQYRGSTKVPGEIAKELGVRFLLTGTVRWAKNPDGTSRVQVSPELVEIGPDGAASSRWQQPFDAPLTDVFKLQGDIAAQVTQAMRVALPGGAAAVLTEAPTKNPAAYDAYLRGEAAWNSGANTAPPALRAALARFQEAVQLDSTFALAWSAVAITSSFLYTNAVPSRQLAQQALTAVQRAEALDPGAVSTQLARFRYVGFIEQDAATALAQIEAAAKASPNDVSILSALATAERSSGMWDESLRHYEAAAALDPRAATRSSAVSATNLWLRRTAASIPPADRALALAPGIPGYLLRRAMLEIQAGDLAGAQRVLAYDQARVPAELATYAAVVWDMGWILDTAAQRVVLAADSTAFDGDIASMAVVRMQLYDWQGNQAQARHWAEIAHRQFLLQMREVPDDAQRPLLNGLALAVLGKKQEALASIQHGLDLDRSRPDAYTSPYFESIAMRTWIKLGETEKALDMLETIMAKPFYMTPAWLRIDPMFTPLRGNPRFEKLAT